MTILTSTLSSVANHTHYQNKQDAKQQQLINAIKRHATNEEINDILYNGANVHSEVNDTTPLSAAVEANHLQAFVYLLDKKADFEIGLKHGNNYKYPLVWFTLWDEKMPFFKLLLEKGVANIRDPQNNDTLLIAATKMLNVEAVKICVDSNKINKHAVDMEGRTALHHALMCRPSELTAERQEIIAILAKEINPELKDIYGNTAQEIFNKLEVQEKLELQAELAAEQNKMTNKKEKKKTYGMKNSRRYPSGPSR